MPTTHHCFRKFSLVVSVSAASLFLADVIAAQEAGPAGYKKSAPFFEGMGSHHFDVSIGTPLARRYFDQGIMLAYGFNHAEAARSFREAQKLDPGCAMAYWGEALVLGPNINAPMDPENVPAAWSAIQKAMNLAAGASERERDYILALSRRYVDDPEADRSPLDQAYADAMRDLTQKYPEDYDAQSLFAEALMDMTPWDYWLPDGTPKEVTKEILTTLERILARNPDHPGANHFYIHAVEAAHPRWAAAAAERLGGLAPGAGHLVHMPSHIFVRVGRYAEASDANEDAIKADQGYITQCHAQGLYPLAYMPHNEHFLAFTASLEGRAERSISAARHMAHHVDHEKMHEPGMGTLQHFYSIPLYALARFGRWNEILNEPKPAEGLKYPQGIWHFARGMALLRKGNADAAQGELDSLQRIAADESLEGVMIMELNKTRDLLQIGSEILSGEIAAASGEFDAAIRHLEKAVALEAALVYDEPQAWFSPSQQSLGAILLDAGHAEKAEEAFRKDLGKYPDNGWSLYGLGQALKLQGKNNEAAAVHERFLKAWPRADITLTRAVF